MSLWDAEWSMEVVWWCFAGDTDLFRIQGTLNQHGYHSILQRYVILSGLRLVGLSFVFQQDNDPNHTSKLCKAYLTKESDGVPFQMTWPPPNWDGLGWVGPRKGKAAIKCSAYVRTPSRLLKKHSRWAGWENAKSVESCHQGKGWLHSCRLDNKVSTWQPSSTGVSNSNTQWAKM